MKKCQHAGDSPIKWFSWLGSLSFPDKFFGEFYVLTWKEGKLELGGHRTPHNSTPRHFQKGFLWHVDHRQAHWKLYVQTVSVRFRPGLLKVPGSPGPWQAGLWLEGWRFQSLHQLGKCELGGNWVTFALPSTATAEVPPNKALKSPSVQQPRLWYSSTVWICGPTLFWWRCWRSLLPCFCASQRSPVNWTSFL